MSSTPSSIPASVTPPKSERTSARRELAGALLKSVSFLVGMSIVLFWVFCAIFGYKIAPYSPTHTNPLETNRPPLNQDWFGTLKYVPPPTKGTHLFGTDNLGRDVFSRVICGARDILIVAPLATLLGTFLGAALGLLLGYYRGWVDDVGSRFVDAVLALPIVVTALMVLAALGPSNTAVVITIGLIFTPLIARTVRSAVLAERELEYVAAARLRGENSAHIMFVEILPNVMPPIIVEFTVRLGYAIFTVATLSFLGFGIQPPSPDWGLQIASTYPLIPAGYWWESAFPALAIATLVVSVNLVADAVQQAVER
jgi:peptide/nickel transport system permease protein